MGFEFGSVAHLDVQITLISFISVIVFVVVFDTATGIMEYFLEGSKLYGKMIQMIYKELMLMGLVSFIVVITESAQTKALAESEKGHTWFLAIDFSHILLFFVTFFFVVHAFYLMRASIISGAKYKFMFGEPMEELIDAVEDAKKDRLKRFLFNFDFLPLSSIRERVEFRLVHVLFRDAYCLPEDFHFAYYLSGCFDRYALKTINRSLITWFVLILMAILNFVRVSADIGFQSCTNSAAHGETNTTSSEISHHMQFNYYMDTDEILSRPLTSYDGLVRAQSASAGEESSGPHAYESNMCRKNLVKLFLAAGVLLCLYTLIILFFSRLYKLRMLRKTGLKTTEDYLDFLKFLEDEETKMKDDIIDQQAHKRELRKKNRALKLDIEHVLDDDESAGENEHKALAEGLATAYNKIRDEVSNFVLKVQIWAYNLFNMKKEEGGKGLLSRLQNVTESALDTDKEKEGFPVEATKSAEVRGGEGITAIGQLMKGKSALHLHRSTRLQSQQTGMAGEGGGRNSFLAHVQERVADGKDQIIKSLTASHRMTSFGGSKKAIKVQPVPEEEADLSSNAKGNSVNPGIELTPLIINADDSRTPGQLHAALSSPSNSARVSSTKSNGESGRQRMTAVYGNQSTPPVSSSSLFAPKTNGARQTIIKSMSRPARTSTGIDSSVSDFLTAQLNSKTPPASNPPPAALSSAGPPRRRSVVLQRLSDVHEQFQANKPLASAHLASGENSHEQQEEVVQLGLIEKYKIHRHEQRRNRRSTVSNLQKSFRSSNGSNKSPSSLGEKVVNFFSLPFFAGGKSKKESKDGSNPRSTRDVEVGRADNSDDDDEEKKSNTEEDSFHTESLDDFTDIYLWGRPNLFYGAVEICLMFHCLYLAFWLSDFSTLANLIVQPDYWTALTEIAMILPVFFVLPAIGNISEACSMMSALSQLNLEVIHEVLVEAENTRALMIDLRKKVLARIKALESAHQDIEETVHALFEEIDEKNNGWIDKFHFRLFLRSLRLTFSDDRFNRLYRAVDSSGDGKIEWDELHELLFGHLDDGQKEGGNNKADHDHSNEGNDQENGDPKSFSALLRSKLMEKGGEDGKSRRDADSDEDEDNSSSDSDRDSSHRSAFSRQNSRGGSSSAHSRHNSVSNAPKSRNNSMIKMNGNSNVVVVSPFNHSNLPPLDASSQESTTQSTNNNVELNATNLASKLVTIKEEQHDGSQRSSINVAVMKEQQKHNPVPGHDNYNDDNEGSLFSNISEEEL